MTKNKVLGSGAVVVVVVVDVVVVVVVVVPGEISSISHTLHSVDFNPGFASSINQQFSVEQSHVALQTGVSLDALPANKKLSLEWILK